MGRRKDYEFWESAKMNNALARRYYNQLMELSISMFKWNNLPDTIDSRFLELTLFSMGSALFLEDEVLGHLALRATYGGGFNVYNIPITRRAYASNGYYADRTIEDSVIIYNNLIHTNTLPYVENFAKRLYNLDSICDINCQAMRTPLLITCDENMRLTMEQLYMKYTGNQPVIFGSKQLNPESLQVLKTDAPFVANDVYTYKTSVWNEALTFLGISNVNYEKRERLNKDEVQKAQGGVIANRYSRLEARKQACEQINKMFGLNISVEYREDLDPEMFEMQEDSGETKENTNE